MLPAARTFTRALSSYAHHARSLYPKKADKVVVAMSGGVDSSVTAKLLADQDYDLSAVFMRNWDTRDESGTDEGCEWKKDWHDVQQVCRQLDIPCTMIDLSREYWTRVFEPSLKAWEAGDTPNPDIWCNKEVKFGALLDRLTRDTATQFLATGHYARKSHHPTTHRPHLLRSRDRTKDQTFYLSSIGEPSLAQSIFPLQDLLKSEVREIASRAGLVTAKRDESMGLCFVGEKRKFSDFLASYIPPKPGPIIDLTTGEILGEHQGLWTYTIGQGAKLAGSFKKMFVCRKDKERNTIYVVIGGNESLWVSKISAKHWSWISPDEVLPGLDASGSLGEEAKGVDNGRGFRARTQFRHRMLDVGCSVTRSKDGGITITFDEPQKAVATGQTAVLWDGDRCLGCGNIVDVEVVGPNTTLG